MNPQETLAQRRVALVAQSAAQRGAIIAGTEPFLRAAAAFDRITGPFRRHPVLTSLAIGAVTLVGSRKISELASRALTIYMLLRRR